MKTSKSRFSKILNKSPSYAEIEAFKVSIFALPATETGFEIRSYVNTCAWQKIFNLNYFNEIELDRYWISAST